MGKRWTEKEVEFLKKNYKDVSCDKVSKVLRRSCISIWAKAQKLQLYKMNHRIWNDEEIDYLKNNCKTMFYRKIGEILGKSYKAINMKAWKLGLYKDRVTWNSKETEFLRNNYTTIPPIKISEYLNKNYRSIITKANSLGLKVDYKYFKPVYNENFFDKNSIELYWVVGLVLSDGSISDPSYNYFVRIAMCDQDVIEKIKNITNHRGNIWQGRPKGELRKNCYTIGFFGKKVWDFFTSLGMDNNKSYTAKLPIISNKFMPSLIRGVFDGDGSLITQKNYYPTAEICGTEAVIKAIASNFDLHHTIYRCNNKTSFTIFYTGKRALKFLEYIYQDSTPSTRMDRKYNKYLDVLKFWKGADK